MMSLIVMRETMLFDALLYVNINSPRNCATPKMTLNYLRLYNSLAQCKCACTQVQCVPFFFLKCIKKPTFIAHSMMMEMYLLEVSFGWWDKNTTQRWIICLPKRPLIHIWMSRLKFGLRRKIGQLFSEMNLCDSIYLLFSACGVALLIELPLYNSHEILLAKN